MDGWRELSEGGSDVEKGDGDQVWGEGSERSLGVRMETVAEHLWDQLETWGEEVTGSLWGRP